MNTSEAPSVDPEVKKEINKEGFEGNAAVIIGKKEELPNLKEKLETEGRVENLATYIRLNKQIFLPIDSPEAKSLDVEKMKSAKGESYLSHGCLEYIDKDGNFCKVIIIQDAIAEIAKDNFSDIKAKLQDLGFRFPANLSNTFLRADHSIGEYQSRLSREYQEKTKTEFDF